MKVAIDISQIVYEGTGSSRYVNNLIKGLLEYDKKNQYLFLLFNLRRNLNLDLTSLINACGHKIIRRSIPPKILHYLFNTWHSPKLEQIITEKPDIYISSDWAQASSDALKFTIIHDVIFAIMPESVHPYLRKVQTKRLQRIIEDCVYIITDSLCTQNDLIKIYPEIPKERIKTIYPPVLINSVDQKTQKETLLKYSLNRSFFLTIGKNEPRKNFLRLLEAWRKSHILNCDLVIAGPSGWGEQVCSTKNVKYLGFVSEDEKSALYQNALFFIMPSLYEGFGYPILEAMKLGCPVACSNNSSLAELSGEAAITFDPNNIDDIKQSILMLYSNQTMRQTLIKKGLQKAKKFEMKPFINQFIDYIENIYQLKNYSKSSQ